ncbi:MAG: hypothetical protein ACQEP5_09045 [Actinomycetota bacterium]
MPKKMHSFRLDGNLVREAKETAEKLSISLSALVSLALREKINNAKGKNNPLEKIAGELKLLRDYFEKSSSRK